MAIEKNRPIAVEQIKPEDLAQLVQEAYAQLQGKVVRTATTPLRWLGVHDGSTGSTEVYAKLEGHQHTGSFKYRGALNAVISSKAKTVVTASAGNHALALCAASRAEGRNSHIVVPVGVSEIKAKRILDEADTVSFSGNDLYEATLAALHRVAEHGDQEEYISPYGAVNVAAGAGTMIVEATEDVGEFDYIVVPLGGGGLASGVAAWCSVHSPKTKIIAVQPAIFSRTWNGSRQNALKTSEILFQKTAPSQCDGLGVQLVDTTPLANIIDNQLDRVVLVSEDEVSLAIAEAMRFQSLSVEGSAAAAIAAYHQLSSTLSGKVLLLLTGGNVAPSVLARALVHNVGTQDMRRKMGLRNIFNPAERYSATETRARDTARHTTTVVSGSKHGLGVAYSPIKIIEILLRRLLDSLEAHRLLDNHRREVSAELKLRNDLWCQDSAYDLSLRVKILAMDLQHDLAIGKLPYWIAEERYRLLLQMHSTSRCLFDRASPSYDQALTEWFADAASQNSAMVNYDRYGALQLRNAELMMLGALKPSETYDTSLALLLTSSGMAAFQIVLHYILERLHSEDTVLLPPYIYFEASEQIISLSKTGAYKVSSATSYEAVDLVAAAEECNAKVVCIDPVANVAGLPTTDVREFARLVSSTPGWESRIVLIDGTMVSGGLPVFDWFVGRHAPLVLYSESASKYTQLGLDIQMGGLVVFPMHIEADMRKIRRDVGAVMYGRGVSLLPSLDYDVYQSRVSILGDNAAAFCDLLATRIDPGLASVAYPKQWSAYGWRHGGAVVTLDFVKRGLNQREALEACIGLILSESQARDFPITKGVSFGFSSARVSASSSMAEGVDPFLRISVGVEQEHVPLLVEVVARAIHIYAQTFVDAI
jgi:threonine dehydratase/cystathionine beta-lyase/cystathionine gamma-synthase